MQKIKMQRKGSIINFVDDNKKFIAESSITPNTSYSTKEWIRHEKERYFLLVEPAQAEAEKLELLLLK
jgi:hypothetical protein